MHAHLVVMVGPGGIVVEQVLADCATVAEVARLVDLATLVSEQR